MKSLKLDHPVQFENASHTSGIMQGRLVSAHPDESGYALVDFGDGNPVNVRMADSTVGWVGAIVNVQILPDGTPIIGSVDGSVARPSAADSLTFGPTGDRIVENERLIEHASARAEELKSELVVAKTTIDAAQARVEAAAAEMPAALQKLEEYQAQAKEDFKSTNQKLDEVTNTANEALFGSHGAFNYATEIDGKVKSAKQFAEDAAHVALQAKEEATLGVDLASKASRRAYGYSFENARGKLTSPYRDGDTLMVGSGNPFKVNEIYAYRGGSWARDLLRVGNLVVDNALWAKLIETDQGNIKNLLVRNQAAINELIVYGKAKMRELISEIIKGKRIQGAQIIGGTYESDTGRIQVNDHGISVYKQGRYTGYVALVPGGTSNRADPGIEFKSGSSTDNPLQDTPTFRIAASSANDAGSILIIFSKSGENIASFGELGNMMTGAQGPEIQGIRTDYSGVEYGERHTVTPRYSISGDHVNLRMNSVTVNEWETEVLYKLPYITNVTGGMSRYIRLENLPRTSKTYMWELILVDAVGISVDWAGTSNYVYQFKIKNTGSYTHDVAKAYIRRTLVES